MPNLWAGPDSWWLVIPPVCPGSSLPGDLPTSFPSVLGSSLRTSLWQELAKKRKCKGERDFPQGPFITELHKEANWSKRPDSHTGVLSLSLIPSPHHLVWQHPDSPSAPLAPPGYTEGSRNIGFPWLSTREIKKRNWLSSSIKWEDWGADWKNFTCKKTDRVTTPMTTNHHVNMYTSLQCCFGWKRPLGYKGASGPDSSQHSVSSNLCYTDRCIIKSPALF